MVKVKVELVIKYPGRGDYRNNAEALLNSSLMNYFHTAIRKAIIAKMSKDHIKWLEGNLKRITKALESASYTITK